VSARALKCHSRSFTDECSILTTVVVLVCSVAVYFYKFCRIYVRYMSCIFVLNYRKKNSLNISKYCLNFVVVLTLQFQRQATYKCQTVSEKSIFGRTFMTFAVAMAMSNT